MNFCELSKSNVKTKIVRSTGPALILSFKKRKYIFAPLDVFADGEFQRIKTGTGQQ